jgi:hypothetical protein
MGFPASIEDFDKCIGANLEASKAAAKEEQHHAEIRKSRQSLAEILRLLRTSWQERDPGKYGPAYFFLDSTLSRRAVVREFLPDGACPAIHYEIVDLGAVGRHKCSRCGNLEPVIELYVQTRDSPDFDEWLKSRFVFCVSCNAMTTVSSRTSDCRF